MLHVIVYFRRTGDTPDTPLRTEEFLSVPTILNAAQLVNIFANTNPDADILNVEIRNTELQSFRLQGFLRVGAYETVENRRLEIAQHLELSLAEYLDEINCPISELQVTLTKE
jgi:hypothetical protein